MKEKNLVVLCILCLLIMAVSDLSLAADQAIKTNKDKLLTLAVQGTVAPARTGP